MVNLELQNHYNTIVIGGGISGLWSALTISKKGFDTLLLEASPELGGACKTIVLKGESGGDYFVDLGPHAITELADGPFKDLATYLHPDKKPQFKPHRYYLRKQNGDLEKFPETLRDFVFSNILPQKDKMIIAGELAYSVAAHTFGRLKDKSLYDVLSKYHLDAKTHNFIDAFARFVSGVDSKNTTISRTLDACGFYSHDAGVRGKLKGLSNLAGTNRSCEEQGYPIGPGKGIQTIVDCVVGSFPESASYRLGEPVLKIESVTSGFNVHTLKDNYFADRVIYSGEAKKLPGIMKVPDKWANQLAPLKQATALVLCLGLNKKIFDYEGSEIFFDRKSNESSYWAMPISNTDARLAPVGKQLVEFSTTLESEANVDSEKQRLYNTILSIFPDIDGNIDMEKWFVMAPEKAAISSYHFPPRMPFKDLDFCIVGTDIHEKSMGLTRAAYSVIRMLKDLNLYDLPNVY